MTKEEIKELIMEELPAILREDDEVRNFIVRISREHCAGKKQTEDRFETLINELRRDREEQAKKWDEQAKKWDEQEKKWAEQEKKWWAVQEAITAANQKHDSSIGALGARWGIYSEESFRNGLRAILEQSFGVEVIRVNEYDDEGIVFGRPDQVELDIIIKNGMLIICELKSSVSKSDMYAFEKKVRFYEKRHNRKASRMMAISPMVDEMAKLIARDMNIEVYSHSHDVPQNPA